MADNLQALSFIARLGLGNLKDEVLVESVKASLQGMGAQIMETMVTHRDCQIQTDTATVSGSKSNNYVDRGALDKNIARREAVTATELEILNHLMELDADEDQETRAPPSVNMQIRTIELSLALRDLIIKARDQTEWCSTLNSGQQEEGWSMEWDGMNRLIALVVIAMALEKRASKKNLFVVPALVNHLKRSFRYTFQSSESDLCVAEYPEWALNHMKDVLQVYSAVFRRIKRDVTTGVDELFAELVANDRTIGTDENRPRIKAYFEKLCLQFLHGDFFYSWTSSLVKEARWFVYSRLPLLVYDYRNAASDVKLSVNEIANIADAEDPVTKITVTQSFYEDEYQVNLVYNLIRSMTELAATIKAIDHAAAFELFSDFDKNNPVPYVMVTLEKDSLRPRLELGYDYNIVYGALDALISLEATSSKKVLKQLIMEDKLLDNIRCDSAMQNHWYLQDASYITQPLNTIIALLKMFDERCKCLESCKAKSDFTVKVIVPIINSYLEYIKTTWNAEDDIFSSCSLTAFLIESTTTMHDFLVKYPYSVYMPQILASIEKVMHKMILIVGDYVIDIIAEPFSTIHEKRLDVVTFLKEKILQIAVLCNLKSYRQIIKQLVETVEKLLVGILIPQKASHIVLTKPDHVDMALYNCNLVYYEMKELTDSTYCPESTNIIEDIKTLLDTNSEELINTVETMKSSLTIQSIFNDDHASHGGCDSERTVERITQLTKRISIHCDNADEDAEQAEMENILTMSDSDSEDSLMDNAEDESVPITQTVGEQLIIDRLKQRLKVQKLTAQQIYTLSLHILNATLSPWQIQDLTS
ncbi:hypothetical protein BgAZ_306320 [Babesia gibsoni]|uniref:Uncharacterized protein n=1 Tax=Babesia gibsoni TaxID=33632 RepID=A0AAD8LJ07_BABGI|nr:hypothetical protein BgAZ_306320 [Babesia gibsoni]